MGAERWQGPGVKDSRSWSLSREGPHPGEQAGLLPVLPVGRVSKCPPRTGSRRLTGNRYSVPSPWPGAGAPGPGPALWEALEQAQSWVFLGSCLADMQCFQQGKTRGEACRSALAPVWAWWYPAFGPAWLRGWSHQPPHSWSCPQGHSAAGALGGQEKTSSWLHLASLTLPSLGP